jgi:hypothetical protein
VHRKNLLQKKSESYKSGKVLVSQNKTTNYDTNTFHFIHKNMQEIREVHNF